MGVIEELEVVNLANWVTAATLYQLLWKGCFEATKMVNTEEMHSMCLPMLTLALLNSSQEMQPAW